MEEVFNKVVRSCSRDIGEKGEVLCQGITELVFMIIL